MTEGLRVGGLIVSSVPFFVDDVVLLVSSGSVSIELTLERFAVYCERMGMRIRSEFIAVSQKRLK